MGIINVTPDSFYENGRSFSVEKALQKTAQFLGEGADIIDVGAMSTRPGSTIIHEEVEAERLLPVIQAIAKEFPAAIISVDTIRASIAKVAYEAGAHMINDISGGTFDKEMFPTVASLQIPYILMHIQGMPDSMQVDPEYDDLFLDVTDYFAQKIAQLKSYGVKDIIIDPGLGFGKTQEHNLKLLAYLPQLHLLFQLPILVGVSRKSLVTKVLGVTADEALNGTTVMNTIALLNGANILRVHDVKEAVEVRKLIEAYHTATIRLSL